MSPRRQTQIREYLLSRNLPIDLLIEVQDHFFAQISDLEKEGRTFEEAFEKTQNSWSKDLATYYPFYILNRRQNTLRTRFEQKIKRKASFKMLLQSAVAAIAVCIPGAYLHLANSELFPVFVKYSLFAALIFACLPVAYNLIINRIAFQKRHQSLRFSVFHWRSYFIFAAAYWGIQYIRPSTGWVHHADSELYLKSPVFFALLVCFFYTGIAQIRFAIIFNKLKQNLEFVR